MNILKPIDRKRRKIMRRLFSNFGGLNEDVLAPEDKPMMKRILISRPNARLGNLLLITPLVQEVEKTFPGCKIDLFVRGNLAPVIFENFSSINNFYTLPKKPFDELLNYLGVWVKLKKTSYDLVINVVNNSSSGRISTQFVSSKYRIFGLSEKDPDVAGAEEKHMAKNSVYAFRKFLGNLKSRVPVPVMDLKLSEQEISTGKKILKDLVENKKKTISLFTHATRNKAYPEIFWTDLYKRLQEEFPDYNIVEVLPVENISRLSFTAPTFYSKDIREIGAFLRNTVVFIGADSGIMHLASAAQTPTIGLFAVTDEKMYAPYNKKSMAFNTNKRDQEELISEIREVLLLKEEAN